MNRYLLTGLLAGVALNASADNTAATLKVDDWAACQTQKCNFECVVQGNWMHLGNTGRDEQQKEGYRVSQSASGLLLVVLANQGDPINYLISQEQAFCRFQPAP